MVDSNTTLKVALVTGANTGIGLETSKELLKSGYKVVFVCRNKAKGRNTLKMLSQEFEPNQMELIIGDLSTIDSVRTLGNVINQRLQRLDLLIHNAGIWQTSREITEDGLEKTFMVNYLAEFLLTNLLLSLMKESDDPRIVLVGAKLYSNGEFTRKTPFGNNFSRIRTYADSKLCQVMFMIRLSQKLENTNIIVNTVHPGVFKTGLIQSKGIFGWLMKFFKLFLKSPVDSYIGPVHLAMSDTVTSSGNFYDVTQRVEINDLATDPDLIYLLWKVSEELCGIIW